VDASGNSYVAWKGGLYDDIEIDDIYWTIIDSSGTVLAGTPQNLSNTAGVNEWAPDIGIDASGNSYVTWHGFDGGDYEIYWRKVSPSGALTPAVSPLAIPNNTSPDEWPSIAVNPTGISFLTWTNDYSYDEEIFWARVDTSGSSVVMQQITDDANQDTDPEITADSSGNSYISWTLDIDFSGWDEIYWAKVDSSGTSWITRNVSNNSEDDHSPQIAVDSSGTSFLAWEFHGPADDIFWARVSSSGDVVTPQNISNDEYEDYNPKIAVDSSGNSYIVWVKEIGEGEDGGNDELFWAKVTSSGSVVLTMNVSNNALLDDYPEIAVDTCGAFFITWYNELEYGDEGDKEVYFYSIPCLQAAVTSQKRPQMSSILPLASTHISEGADLLTQGEDLLSQAQSQNLDTATCEKLIGEAQELLASAKAHMTNPIYANNLALQAIQKLQQALECLKALLG